MLLKKILESKKSISTEKAAFALIVKDKKFLMIKRKKDKSWGLPGGRVDIGENTKDALRREIYEEIGLNIRVVKPLFKYVLQNGRKIRIYSAIISDSDEIILDRKEHNKFVFASIDDLSNKKIHDIIRPFISRIKKGRL